MSAKVIVVDDEEWIVDEIVEALAGEGYECVGAHSVAAAMEAMEKDPEIRIVVTDLRMPGGSGMNLIAQARQAFDREIYFIVMSGNGSPRAEMKKEELEIFEVLRKPIDINVLLETVRRADQEQN